MTKKEGLGAEKKELSDLVKKALEEDRGGGDLTTKALVAPQAPGRAAIRSKAHGVLSGQEAAAEVFRQVGAEYDPVLADGTAISPGDLVGRGKGKLVDLLCAERTALNLLCHLSGISTLTREFVDAVSGTRARIMDTRKTAPLHRLLQKAAVRAGGGTNHRMGLADQVLVKENHIAAARASGVAQSFAAAVRLLGSEIPEDVVIGIEVEDLSQFHIALEARPAYVLCDNFNLESLELAVRIRDGWPGEGRPEIEASGGVTIENVAAIAATGVDRISVGALTHSAPALDLSMDIED